MIFPFLYYMAYIGVGLFNATEYDLWIKQIQILSVVFLKVPSAKVILD